MSTRDAERALTTVLRRHAEVSMTRTNTNEELLRFQKDAESHTGGRGRRWLAGGAAAAAVVGLALWTTGPAERADPGPAEDTVAEQTVEERVAQGFVDAYTRGDLAVAASHLAPDAQVWDGWRSDRRRDEAWSRDFFVRPCRKLTASSKGTMVGCPFDYNVLHSEQLGLGPFTHNSFVAVVEDGEVVSVDMHTAYGTNGQSELYEAVGAWVREKSPEDWAFMERQGGHSRAAMKRWYRLWERYSQEYADARTQRSDEGAGS